MIPISEFDLQNMQRRTASAINPQKAAADDAQKRDKHAVGMERELQDQIEQYARLRGCFVLRPAMHKRTTFRKGYPDLTIFGPQSRAVLIEAKCEGNTPDEDQEQCIAELRRSGAAVRVCYNLQDAMEFITDFLFP